MVEAGKRGLSLGFGWVWVCCCLHLLLLDAGRDAASGEGAFQIGNSNFAEVKDRGG